ncbi:MAG: hypothetical protein M1835_003863 [Candelina submexicana]|nr:MAG: hypothetical protein M1835_003863 [Candelina submexicana]
MSGEPPEPPGCTKPPSVSCETSDDTIRVSGQGRAKERSGEGFGIKAQPRPTQNLHFAIPVPQQVQLRRSNRNIPPTPSSLPIAQTPSVEPIGWGSQQQRPPTEVDRRHQLRISSLWTSRYPYYVAAPDRINDPEFQWWLSTHGLNFMRERQRQTGDVWSWEEYRQSESGWRDYINSR